MYKESVSAETEEGECHEGKQVGHKIHK